MNLSQFTSTNKSEEFYTSLKEKLNEIHNFPEDYLFKFIIPNHQEKLADIYRIFDELKTTISHKNSRNEKYISLSINAFVMDANQVVDIYKKVSQLEDVIML